MFGRLQSTCLQTAAVPIMIKPLRWVEVGRLVAALVVGVRCPELGGMQVRSFRFDEVRQPRQRITQPVRAIVAKEDAVHRIGVVEEHAVATRKGHPEGIAILPAGDITLENLCELAPTIDAAVGDGSDLRVVARGTRVVTHGTPA
ncbi:hypothetical protein MUNTM_49510 [Mycobacterium sp. MUNTM1]